MSFLFNFFYPEPILVSSHPQTDNFPSKQYSTGAYLQEKRDPFKCIVFSPQVYVF